MYFKSACIRAEPGASRNLMKSELEFEWRSATRWKKNAEANRRHPFGTCSSWWFAPINTQISKCTWEKRADLHSQILFQIRIDPVLDTCSKWSASSKVFILGKPTVHLYLRVGSGRIRNNKIPCSPLLLLETYKATATAAEKCIDCKSGFKIISCTVSTLEGGGSILLYALYIQSSLRSWLVRNARARLLPAALASVSFGFVLVRVRVRLSSTESYSKVEATKKLIMWSRRLLPFEVVTQYTGRSHGKSRPMTGQTQRGHSNACTPFFEGWSNLIHLLKNC